MKKEAILKTQGLVSARMFSIARLKYEEVVNFHSGRGWGAGLTRLRGRLVGRRPFEPDPGNAGGGKQYE